MMSASPTTPSSGRCAVCIMLTMSVFGFSIGGDDDRREWNAHDARRRRRACCRRRRRCARASRSGELRGACAALARPSASAPALVGDEHRNSETLDRAGRRDESSRCFGVLIRGRRRCSAPRRPARRERSRLLLGGDDLLVGIDRRGGALDAIEAHRARTPAREDSPRPTICPTIFSALMREIVLDLALHLRAAGCSARRADDGSSASESMRPASFDDRDVIAREPIDARRDEVRDAIDDSRCRLALASLSTTLASVGVSARAEAVASRASRGGPVPIRCRASCRSCAPALLRARGGS